MLCSCILAIAMLFSGTSSAALLQQDSKSAPPQSQTPSPTPSTPPSKSSENPPGEQDQSSGEKKESEKPQDQPAATKKESEKSKEPTSAPEKPKDAPQSGQSEGAPGEQAQPSPQSGETDKPNTTPPQPENKQQSEEKKTPACASQGSAQGNCAKPTAAQSHRIVIRRGGTGEPTAQLVPGMTPKQAAKHRQTTEQFLNSAEDDLRKLAGRDLNQTQHDTITQIRHYMLDAHSALEDGDLSRARNLAFKAHLLADDLAKH